MIDKLAEEDLPGANRIGPVKIFTPVHRAILGAKGLQFFRPSVERREPAEQPAKTIFIFCFVTIVAEGVDAFQVVHAVMICHS
ncbi:hypothetical protein [Salinibacter ruber]|uniref:hypothetical protein n=1 Tax=Salinibacter ruber TaxID=146919 RepID=UPI0021672B33|nr:hypothetical protein [Salinibacter ruber]MCS4223666.1 hypothetical protein [Salinibacter ruber]